MPYIPSLQEVRGYKDVAPNWRWVVRCPDLVSRGGGSPKPYQGLSRVSTVPFGIVSQIDFSTRQIDSDQRFGAGARSNYPRFMMVPNCSITFYETMDYAVTRYLRSWQNLIIDEDHNYGIPAAYKHPIILFAFDVVSNTAPKMTGTLLGCWPTHVSGYTYQYDQSGPITLSVDFAVDEDVVAVGGASGALSFGTGGGSPFGILNQFSSTVKGVADDIRAVRDTVLAPIRDIRGIVNEGVQAGRDIAGAVNQVRNMPSTIRSELSGITREFTGIPNLFRGS